MASNLQGKQEPKEQHIEGYKVPGRGIVPRKQLVQEVKAGKHPNHTVYKRNGTEYVRAKPGTIVSRWVTATEQPQDSAYKNDLSGRIIETGKQESKEALPKGIGAYRSGRSDISIHARQILRDRDKD